MSLTHKRVYEFGEFRLKVTARILERDGTPVPLGAKAFEVLTCLVMDAGRVVSKDTLMKTVWPEAFVAEANLSQHIFALRKAFGDRASFIVTIPGRGYQFTEQVRELTEHPSAPPNRNETFLTQRTTERRRIIIEDTTEISTLASGMSSLPIALEALRAHHVPTEDAWAVYHDILDDISPRSALPVAQITLSQRLLAAAAHLQQRLRHRNFPVGAACAAAALILLAAWFFPQRSATAPHPNRSVEIAQFENRTGDPEFDVMLQKALEIDLGQSPYLTVFGEPETERTQQAAFTPATAAQLCQRSNRPVLVTGSVAKVGSVYLLTVEALDCESGSVLAGTMATAETKQQMLQAIDAASLKLRHALGEPAFSADRIQSPPSDQ